ncbi:hypothetical protein [Leptolyngbya sp. Heron Island J]|uniref:hypothetical protein n=1 Tax=Leptolyngbya sp. Heron Island J TaxID=1385935 RepID=UPI0004288F08|nr:hypothetical protein [Leptolyngbya sp. Heron Island J]
MSSFPLNSVQTCQSKTLTDAIAKRLNQLPLQTQQQVLDFVEFLLHHHQIDQAVQPFNKDLKEDATVWEASTDEDWLALEAQLAAAKQ